MKQTPEERKRKKSEIHKRYALGLRQEALSAYAVNPDAPACADCGSDEDLCLDHIHGGGIEHRKLLLGDNVGGKFYRALKRLGFPHKDKIQVLCKDCNLSRRRGKYGAARRFMIEEQKDLIPITIKPEERKSAEGVF